MNKIVIWDEEESYVIRLTAQLNRCKSLNVMYLGITNEQQWKQVIVTQDIILLIVSLRWEQWLERYMNQENEENWQQLECPVLVLKSEVEDEMDLAKYESVANIQKKIESVLQKQEVKNNEFCSVGVIPTMDCDTLRDYWLSESSKTDLYWEAVCFGDNDCTNKKTQQILYAVKMRSQTFAQDFSQYLSCREDQAYVGGVVSFLDYREWGREDYGWLFSCLEQVGYETIHFYMNMGIVKNEEIFFCFDQIVIATIKGQENRCREIKKMLQLYGIPEQSIVCQLIE